MGKKGRFPIQSLRIQLALDLKSNSQKDDFKMLRLLPAFLWGCLETCTRGAASQKDKVSLKMISSRTEKSHGGGKQLSIQWWAPSQIPIRQLSQQLRPLK